MRWRQALFHILMAFIIEYGITIPISQVSSPSTVSKCFIQILNKYLTSTQKLSINYLNESNLIANEILQNVQIPRIVNSLELRKESGIDKRMLTDVILILDEPIDINFVLNTTLWYGDSVFLIVIKSASNLQKKLNSFWQRNVHNVYTLVPISFNNIRLYSFVPYATEDCSTVKPVLLDKCMDGRFETESVREITDKEKIKNVSGCPINISVMELKPFTILQGNQSRTIDGVEGKILLEISKILNFTPWFGTPRDEKKWGIIKPQPDGLLGEVYVGFSDFGIAALSPLVEMYENLDLSIPYSVTSCATFAVPTGKRAKQDVWISFLLSEFSDELWLGLVLSITTTLLIIYFLLTKTGDRYDATFRMLCTILGVSTKRPKFNRLETLYLIWVWASFVIMSFYQSVLSSKLSVPTQDKDIETFEQLFKSGLELTGFGARWVPRPILDENPFLKKLIDRFVYTNLTHEERMEIMRKSKNITSFIADWSLRYHCLLHEESRGEITVLKECVLIYSPVVAMKKYSPFRNQVNKIISRLVHGGVTQHWMRSYAYDVPQRTDPLLKLTLEKLKGIFFFWMGGLAVSVLVLILEMLAHRYRT